MIVEREEEIERFIPEEYWSVTTELVKDTTPFNARLYTLEGERFKQFTITDGERAAEVKTLLETAANGQLIVADVEKKQRKRNPVAPFTTSTLQQEGVRKLGFNTRRTMSTAQQLYEGIDVGQGAEGLITYMRTDSVSLSKDAVNDIRAHVEKRYGKDYLPDAPQVYKLYSLIWKRTIACQMIHATMDQVSVEFSCGDNNSFRASGSTVKFAGFMKVYQEDQDDKKADAENDEKRLPELNKGDKLDLDDIVMTQHFTEPPPRYTEASLVKALEEYGIGRPSTYASIISTLQGRQYVELESRRFTPTDVGSVVNKFLSKHFTKYVDYDFTANLEDELDAVSRGEKEWVTDPETGKPVTVRMGRFGSFVQIGTKEDEDKPKFAGLRPGQKMNKITFDEAMILFQLPREVGETEADGKIKVSIGRFGPYVQYSQYSEHKEKTEVKYASIKEAEDDPYTITFERAMEIVEAKKEADANRIIKIYEEDPTIRLENGRWGPYLTNDLKNAKLSKEQKEAPLTVDYATAKKLIDEAPEKRGRGKKKAAAKKKAVAKKATAKKASKKKSAKKKSAKKKTSRKKAAPKAPTNTANTAEPGTPESLNVENG